MEALPLVPAMQHASIIFSPLSLMPPFPRSPRLDVGQRTQGTGICARMDAHAHAHGCVCVCMRASACSYLHVESSPLHQNAMSVERESKSEWGSPRRPRDSLGMTTSDELDSHGRRGTATTGKGKSAARLL